jgi:hypothetical protein
MGPARMRESLTTTPGIREQPRNTKTFMQPALPIVGYPIGAPLKSRLASVRYLRNTRPNVDAYFTRVHRRQPPEHCPFP